LRDRFPRLDEVDPPPPMLLLGFKSSSDFRFLARPEPPVELRSEDC
jgi:hypothetical protein